MKAVLATRMNAGNPPDSFQVHLGKELTEGYAKADKMEDLNALFASEGWDKTFPKGLLDAAASGGKQFSVPVNIHRSNVMWFNKKIMADNGIDKAPTTFDEWFAMAEKLGLDLQTFYDISSKASGQWDKLENIFEDRVAKALNRMGMPSAQDLHALEARIAAIEAQLGNKTTPAKKTTAKSKTTATKK